MDVESLKSISRKWRNKAQLLRSDGHCAAAFDFEDCAGDLEEGIDRLKQNQIIYVICNNDALLQATTNEKAAEAEVLRLREGQTNESYFYHYHKLTVY